MGNCKPSASAGEDSEHWTGGLDSPSDQNNSGQAAAKVEAWVREQQQKLCQSFLKRFESVLGSTSQPDPSAWKQLLKVATHFLKEPMQLEGVNQKDALELVNHLEVQLSTDLTEDPKPIAKADQLFELLKEETGKQESSQGSLHLQRYLREAVLGMADRVKAEDIMLPLQSQLQKQQRKSNDAERYKERSLELLRLGPGAAKHDQDTWERLVSLMSLYLNRLEVVIQGPEQQDDPWHDGRLKAMQEVAEDIEERTKRRGSSKEDGEDPEHVWIQKRIAREVNSRVFKAFKNNNKTLPENFTALQQGRLKGPDGLVPVDNCSFNEGGNSTMMIDEVFDSFGKVFTHVSMDDLCTKTILTTYDDTQQRYLFRDYQNLKRNQEALRNRFVKYMTGLKQMNRRQRLWQFRRDLWGFSTDPCLESFRKVVDGFTSFLVVEGEAAKKSLEQPPQWSLHHLKEFKEFLDTFASVLEHVLLEDAESQKSANELKHAIDIFSEGVMHPLKQPPTPHEIQAVVHTVQGSGKHASLRLEVFGWSHDIVSHKHSRSCIVSKVSYCLDCCTVAAEVGEQLSSLRSTLGFKAYWPDILSVSQETTDFFAKYPPKNPAFQRAAEIKALLTEVLPLRRTGSMGKFLSSFGGS